MRCSPGGSRGVSRSGLVTGKGQPQFERLELWASHLWGGQALRLAASP